MRYRNWDIETIKENHLRVVNILKEYYLGNDIATVIRLKKTLQEKDQFTKENNPESM